MNKDIIWGGKGKYRILLIKYLIKQWVETGTWGAYYKKSERIGVSDQKVWDDLVDKNFLVYYACRLRIGFTQCIPVWKYFESFGPKKVNSKHFQNERCSGKGICK